MKRSPRWRSGIKLEPMKHLSCRSGAPWLALLFLAGCSKADERIDLSGHVHVYPGAAIVEFARDSKTMTVKVRNVSEKKLTNLSLQVKSAACTARVTPATIAAIIPGDRRAFAVTLLRTKGAARKRHRLLLTLRSPDLPVAAGLDLIADLRAATDQQWIDVGQVTLVAQQGTRTLYYLLAGVPLLFILGWLGWRWSRPKDDDDPDPPPDKSATSD